MNDYDDPLDNIDTEGPPPLPWSFWFALAFGLTLAVLFVAMIWWVE